jgi:hypothetical protein
MAEIMKAVPLQITIGSYPTNSLNLDQELKLLKAAILYGDQVELYSLKASLIGMILKLKDIPAPLQIRLLEDVSPYLMTDVESVAFLKNLQAYKEVITKRPKPRSVLIMQRQFTNEWRHVRNFALELAHTSGFQDIERAIDAGVVDLHTFETANSQQQAVDFIADCVASASHSPLLAERHPKMEVRDNLILQEFVQGMISTVSDGASLPLFDEQTSSLINAGVKEGKIIPSRTVTAGAKHSALAADLLDRIPHFEDASVDQVLEIRNELDRHLVRFRSALIKFSETIKTAAWEKDFPADADNVFRRDVAPAILDIEDATKSNKLLATIVRGLAEKPLAVPSGSAIGLAISTFSGLPQALTLSIGASAAAGMVIFDAYKAWSEKNLHVQQNAMYFYYHTAKKMERLPSEPVRALHKLTR